MTPTHTTDLQHSVPSLPVDWEAPKIFGLKAGALPKQNVKYRLFHLHEISEDKPKAYRQAIANVFSGLNASECACVYILSGRPDGISLYLGVATAEDDVDIHEAGKIFRAGFEGNFMGGRLINLKNDAPEISALLSHSSNFGQMVGVPSFNDETQQADDEDFQGVERLVNSLLGETWQLVILAEPGKDTEICETIGQIHQIGSDLSEKIKHSVQRSENIGYQSSETTGTSDSTTRGTSKSDTRGSSKGVGDSKGTSDSKNGRSWSEGTNTSRSTNQGTSESRTTGSSDSRTDGHSSSNTQGHNTGHSVALTSERTNKRAEGLLKHLDETLVDRFRRGRAKGMYRTAVYLAAGNRSTFDRLARGLVSTFQGRHSSFTPLQVGKLPVKPYTLPELLQLRPLKRGLISHQSAVAHSLPLLPDDQLYAATWLNSEELALIAGVPTCELPGLKIRKSVDFALNTSHCADPRHSLTLGHIVQHGRPLLHNTVRLSPEDLRKHVFVTGVTGAGKTTTCLKLLLESKLPFLVIEPAKTEYRALHGQGVAVEYYCLGREDLTPFRLNPFELLSRQQSLSSHIDILKATLAAVFPMEAAMPQIVEEAIIKAYEGKGWMIHENENLLVDDPWAADSEAWPTFSGMIKELDGVIKSKGMGREFEEKYRGSLVARLTSLTLGTKGRMLNTRRSMNFDQLLDKHVVIELEELKDEQDKALFMGLILTRVAECMKQRHRRQPDFQHLTLVEEAHRLLTRPEPGDGGSRKMGVEMFANLLAEVRKYGEGLIIADQIPNKLVSDVIKNTNTKIVHRLFAADDRNTIGDAMGLSDEQKDFLPMLQPGETIMYCGGWHGPVRLKVTERASTSGPALDEDEIRRCGQQQLWAQRQFLLPHLAQQPGIADAATLSAFLRDATLMLALWLRVVPSLRVKTDGSFDTEPEPLEKNRQRQRLRLRILEKYQHWQDAGIDAEALTHGLGAVLRDMMFQDSANATVLVQAFLGGFKPLQVSLQAFDELARGVVHHEGFKSLGNLELI